MNAAFELRRPGRPLGRENDAWKEIFADFESQRLPNADAIAAMALENYVEMRSTVREPSFHLRKELSFHLEERHPRRFIPRYSMVMFHRIPYRDAQRLGAIQSGILDELTTDAKSIEQVDFGRADRLIAERLPEDVLLLESEGQTGA
jgi:kynurenine 3-monooxygenase